MSAFQLFLLAFLQTAQLWLMATLPLVNALAVDCLCDCTRRLQGFVVHLSSWSRQLRESTAQRDKSLMCFLLFFAGESLDFAVVSCQMQLSFVVDIFTCYNNAFVLGSATVRISQKLAGIH